MKTEVTFTYKNYRGVVSVRLVRPIMVAFGATGFHPEPQWLLHGWDINKDAERTFAMKDIKDWDPAPITSADRSLPAAPTGDIPTGARPAASAPMGHRAGSEADASVTRPDRGEGA